MILMKKGKIEVNEISESTRKSFRTRVITSIVLMILAIPSCIIGDWVFAAVLLILSLIAYYEFINMLAAKKFPIIIDIFVFVMSIILTYWVWFKQIADSGLINEAGHIVISDISISTLAMATTILVLFLFALMYSRFDVTDVCYLVTMALVVSLGFQSFFFLRYCPMSELSGYYDYGTSIRINIPPLTEERRRELAKSSKRYGEDGKVAIRNIRREYMDELKKDKELPEDQRKRLEQEVQKVTDEYCKKIDDICAEKEKEIMTI